MKKRKEYQKFKIHRKGNIEENIEKLKKELELELKGAPDISQEERKSQIKPEKESKKQNFNYPQYSYTGKKKISILKPLIYFVAFIIFILSFLKFPIFKYNTFLKTDRDFPSISFRGVFYYNILGKKVKEHTVLIVGKKKVVIPYTYEKWINFPKEKKILILKTYLPEASNF